MSVKYGIIRI